MQKWEIVLYRLYITGYIEQIDHQGWYTVMCETSVVLFSIYVKVNYTIDRLIWLKEKVKKKIDLNLLKAGNRNI